MNEEHNILYVFSGVCNNEGEVCQWVVYNIF